MNDTKTKKKMAFPHTLIIILIMIVFAAILTYLIQAGQYDRIEVAGRKVVDPASYHTVPSNRATPFDIFVAIPAGMQAVASISNMVPYYRRFLCRNRGNRRNQGNPCQSA